MQKPWLAACTACTFKVTARQSANTHHPHSHQPRFAVRVTGQQILLGALRGEAHQCNSTAPQGAAEAWNTRRTWATTLLPFRSLSQHSHMAARRLGSEPSWDVAAVGRWGKHRACLLHDCWCCSHRCCCCCCSVQGCRAAALQGSACPVLPWAWQGRWPQALLLLLRTPPWRWLTAWLAAAAGRLPQQSCSCWSQVDLWSGPARPC